MSHHIHNIYLKKWPNLFLYFTLHSIVNISKMSRIVDNFMLTRCQILHPVHCRHRKQKKMSRFCNTCIPQKKEILWPDMHCDSAEMIFSRCFQTTSLWHRSCVTWVKIMLEWIQEKALACAVFLIVYIYIVCWIVAIAQERGVHTNLWLMRWLSFVT